MNRQLFALAVTLTLGCGAAQAAGKLDVVTTTEDLAALAREVGGDRVEVTAIARGYQDPHFVEPKPSFVLKLNRADLLIVIGRDLEIAWLPPLVTQSRNPRIQPGTDGYLDASLSADILDVPTGQVTRAMGDVHPMGNPHYWLDPENGRRIARAIEQRLSQKSPGDAAGFRARLADFERRLTEAEKRWDSRMAPYRGLKIATYHQSWSNLAAHFGLQVVGFVEPKPGIPPSPGHTLELVRDIQRQNVKVIFVEPYFDRRTPDAIARQTGAKVLVMPPSVGGEKTITDYFQLFDYDVNLLVNALANP